MKKKTSPCIRQKLNSGKFKANPTIFETCSLSQSFQTDRQTEKQINRQTLSDYSSTEVEN